VEHRSSQSLTRIGQRDETLDRTIGTVGLENAKNSRTVRSFLLFLNSCYFHSPRYFPKQLHSQTLETAIFKGRSSVT
jgi:hypothetical protein